MSTETEPLDKLRAVNIILENDGEAPVASLDESGFSEAATAQRVLSEISQAVQMDGHGFNTDYARKFIPAVNHEIALPASTLSITPAYLSMGMDVVERNRKLYDRATNSYSFAAPVYLDVVECLEFAELPSPARYYIAVRAARVYQARSTGSPQQNSFTEADEARAEATFRKADRRMAKKGYFRNAFNAQALQRRPM